MKILICGNKDRVNELQDVLGEEHDFSNAREPSTELLESKSDYDLFFDLQADEEPERVKPFLRLSHKPVFFSSAKKQLAAMLHPFAEEEITSYIFGINALRSFMSRGMLEVSMFGNSNQAFNLLKETLNNLNVSYKRVEDRCGMVTPRVILMIINEACFTLQEGTANKQDIDLSLKLGTNYPFGPFEWADKIGIVDVYETLQAIYDDTGDERYKVCPLLKTQYLKGQPFYS